MKSDDTTRTSSTLLRRIADWRDHAAWREFFARYEPYIRSWCREYHLDDHMAKEVSQDFWIELADKMRSFRYEPSRRFRGWLRKSFHWHVVDAIRERSREQTLAGSLDDPSRFAVSDLPPPSDPPDEDEDDEPGARRLRLLELAKEIQAAVRGKVQAQTWQAFWHVSIDGWSAPETAKALNMSRLAVHAAHRRVADRLAEEGGRRLAELMRSTPDTRPSQP